MERSKISIYVSISDRTNASKDRKPSQTGFSAKPKVASHYKRLRETQMINLLLNREESQPQMLLIQA